MPARRRLTNAAGRAKAPPGLLALQDTAYGAEAWDTDDDTGRTVGLVRTRRMHPGDTTGADPFVFMVIVVHADGSNAVYQMTNAAAARAVATREGLGP